MYGLNSLIKMATILAMLAIASGNPNQIVDAVRTAQVQLIDQSKASRWQPTPLSTIHHEEIRWQQREDGVHCLY